MTRIVAWNVYKGGRADGRDRIRSLLDALDALAADVVVLSEITAATHADWTEGLRRIGFGHLASTVDALTAGEKYALLVASRAQMDAVERPGGCPFPSRVLAVELGDLVITGIHPPWNISEGGDRFYDWLRMAVTPMRDRRAVIIGDFNADPDEAVETHAELGPRLERLIEVDGWRDALLEADPDGDHASTFWDVGPRAIDRCLLAPLLSFELAMAHIDAGSAFARMPSATVGVGDGALSDHRPIVVDVG